MNYNLEFFLDQIGKKKVNYKKLLSSSYNLIDNSPVEISLIIGTKGRDKYLKKCLDYFNFAISQSSIKAKAVVVQHDKHPTQRELAINGNASYVFISLDDTDTEGQYSRALAYNVGYFANPNAEYLIFHDIDTLFPHDYFKSFEKDYLRGKGIRWLQNFYGKSLYYLNKDQSKYVFDLNGIANLYTIPNVEKGGPGAAGGSLTCRTDLFLEVGGYDPEIFYGWAPEDSLFWTKLLCLEREVGPIRNCHTFANEINYVYADNPPLRLYHLFHETVPNKRWGEMQEMHDSFWVFDFIDKMRYIKAKRSLFKL
jgi:predicted glycosyltransferase involved in capsule biosynthesis